MSEENVGEMRGRKCREIEGKSREIRGGSVKKVRGSY